MTSTPVPNKKDKAAQTVVPENTESVNIISDVENLIEATPGKSGETLPPINPAPAAIAAAPLPSGIAAPEKKVRGPYKKNRVAAPDVAKTEPTPDKIPVESVARSFNQAFETILIVTMGDDARLDEAEKIAIDAGLSQYMKVKNYDLPPGVALAMCYGAIVAGKIQKPKPKEKILGFWIGIKSKFARRKKDYPENPQPELK